MELNVHIQTSTSMLMETARLVTLLVILVMDLLPLNVQRVTSVTI